jgi:hypothetical protein
MSLEEKIALIGGVEGFYVRGMTSLSLPPLEMADGPMGVRIVGPATAMPRTWGSPLHGMSTWPGGSANRLDAMRVPKA